MELSLLNLGKLKPKTKKHKNLETKFTILASSAPYLGICTLGKSLHLSGTNFPL